MRAVTALSPVVAPPRGPGVAPPPDPPPPRPSTSTSSRGLAAAIVVLALAIGGVAVAMVVTRSENQSARASAAPSATSEAAAPAATATPAETSTPTATDTPEATRTPHTTATPAAERTPTATRTPSPTAGARAEIQAVLVEYYDHVVNGDIAAAWPLLSPTYRTWKSTHGGYRKWLLQESFHRDRLNPRGLHVKILSIDSDVATIDVTGMHYRSNTSPNCAFHGVTWARRSGGRWLYDQGYLQSAQRKAIWQPRQTETLGYVCESDGY
jgi:hypothetical protein